jgi:segregation and condensation protein B
LTQILEAALLAAGEPLPLERLQDLFPDSERPQRAALRQALDQLAEELAGRGIEVQEVASGYRLQVRQELAPWVSRLWEERPTRYSRALLETLAVIAYRQPVTRAEIEELRGVSVGTPIIRTLQEREWIRIVGHRDVPGRPAMLGTTRQFLDYFNLKNLSELPTLLELRGLDEIHPELDLRFPPEQSGAPASDDEQT